MEEKEILQEENNNYQELNDKYLRLYAEFENYKKRVQKEKEEIRNNTKVETLSSIFEIDNDLSIAISKIENNQPLKLILNKIESFLNKHGIETIQTEKYDPNLHEVVFVKDDGNKISEVVSKGYILNGKVIKYPKVILSK